MYELEHKQKVLIMVAILAALFFAAVNMTIVGTALPKIVSIIGGMEYYDWIFTSYMLTATVSAMLVGKLSDIYGRKIFILLGISVFMAGGFLSGTSDNIIQLISFRAFQGFGGGMIMSSAFATVGDLFTPRERGRWQGLLGATFGLASLFGPTLGGYMVDHFNWHWVFWIFLPVGVIAFIMILKLYPGKKEKTKQSIDYAGALLLTTLISSLLLSFTWGGNKYEWISIQIIGLLTLAAVSLILLLIVENKVKNPILPLFLFKNNGFVVSNVVGFLLGMLMFCAIMYMPLYVQGVQGQTATVSGLVEMAMTISMVATSALVGSLITKTGKYKAFGIAGFFVISAGFFLNSTLGVGSGVGRITLQMVLIGMGLGLAMPVFQLTTQNSVEQKYLGVATSTMQVFRQMGGTLGVAIMGTIMNKATSSNLAEAQENQAMPKDMAAFQELANPQTLINHENMAEARATLPEESHTYFDQFVLVLKGALNDSLTYVFLLCGGVAVLAFATTFLLKEIPLRTSNDTKKETPEQANPSN